MSDLVGNPEDRFYRDAAHIATSMKPNLIQQNLRGKNDGKMKVCCIPLRIYFYSILFCGKRVVLNLLGQYFAYTCIYVFEGNMIDD